MNHCSVVAGLMLLGAAGIAQGQEPAAKSTASGVFSNEQAKRGEAAYNANCVTCHGAELRSPDREVPHLSDKAFKFGWIARNRMAVRSWATSTPSVIRPGSVSSSNLS